MRVGRASTHAAGMSSLWHDVDYVPEKELHTPLVTQTFADMPLPDEEHVLPPGEADPFNRQEAAYEVAAKQMERGIKGAAFLHGTQDAGRALQAKSVDPSQDATRLVHHQVQQAQERATKVQAMRGQPASAVETAAYLEAEKAAEAAEMGEGIGAMVGVLTAGAGHMVQAAGMAGAAGQAVAAAAAAAGAAQTTSTGMASALRETDDEVMEAVRRQRRARQEARASGYMADVNDA